MKATILAPLALATVILLTACAVTGLSIQNIMEYSKWFLIAMFIVLLVVSYIPATALWFRVFF